MKNIPETKHPLVLRTDYTNDTAWEQLCEVLKQPVQGFSLAVDFVSDPEFAGMTVEQLMNAPTDASARSFAFIVDHVTLTHPDHPLLVLDMVCEPGRTFRVIPVEVGAVADNLDIANMGFEDFADGTDPDGIFRGFPHVPPMRPPPQKKSFWKSLFGRD